MLRLIHLLTVVLIFCSSAFAQAEDFPYNKIYSQVGSIYKGESGSAVRWFIAIKDYTEDDVTVKKGSLVFFPSNGVSGTMQEPSPITPRCGYFPWLCYTTSDSIKSVLFVDGIVAPRDASHLLEGLRKVTHIDVSGLNTANTRDMSFMFHRTSIANTIVGIEKFDTKNVTNMQSMFDYSNVASLNLKNFDTKNVTNMSGMFAMCYGLKDLDISSFNTENVTDMADMFSGVQVKTLDVSHFNTTKVTNMGGMFAEMWAITSLDLSNFDTRNVTDMSWMFYNSHRLVSIDVSRFNTENVANMKNMFGSCDKLTVLDVSKFNTANVTDMSGMFNGCALVEVLDVSKFNTAKVTNMADMFGNCRQVKTLDLRNFDTRNVTDMSQMFSNTGLFRSLDLSSFNTSNVTDMHGMFHNVNVTELNLENFDTQNVTNMKSMFEYTRMSSLDLSSFDTRNVTDMSSMFSYNVNLKTLDLSNFNTANVTTMFAMFYRCSGLKSLNISHFDIKKVKDTYYMFGSCSALNKLDLSSFVTTDQISISANIFDYMPALDTLILGEGWSKEIPLPKKRMICDNTLPTVDTTKTDGVGHTYVARPLVEITVNKIGSGTVKIPSPAYLWDTLTVTAIADDGYEFRSISSKDVVIENGKFEASKEIIAIDVEFAKVYNITFKDEDGNVLECSGIIDAGKTPSCEGPEKEGTPKYTYTFASWSPEVVAAEADAEYTPLYTESINKYKVTFLDFDSATVISEFELDYGSIVEEPDDPSRKSTKDFSYSFKEWSPEVAFFLTEDVVYYAVYDSIETNTTFVVHNAAMSKLNVHVSGHELQVWNYTANSRYTLMDMQGRVLSDGVADRNHLSLDVPHAGSYMLRVGNQTQRVLVH
ncbi:MAG: BspA family leucine-rich repeat surface protein [Fibrobacter sp.]|nr:BspA family leucine-rich repeat surface protein [Fibrobacter sp.]